MTEPTSEPVVSKPPVIPPPPPGGAKQRKRRQSDRRWLVWIGALALGTALGFGGYRMVKPVAGYFDYWVARAF